MNAAWMHDVGSARHLKLSARMGELNKGAPATFDSKVGEVLAHWMNGLSLSGVKVHQEKPDRTKLQTPSVQQAKEGFELAVVQTTRQVLDVKLLTQEPVKKRYATLWFFHVHGIYAYLVHNHRARVEDEESIGGEAALTQAIEEYDFHVDGPVHKEISNKYDLFRASFILPPLLLRFGALRSYKTWLNKTLQAFQEIGPFTDYVSELTEVFLVNFSCGTPIGILCGFEGDARQILAATGLAEWTDTGMEALWAPVSASLPFGRSHMRVFAYTYTRTHAPTHERLNASAQSRI